MYFVEASHPKTPYSAAKIRRQICQEANDGICCSDNSGHDATVPHEVKVVSECFPLQSHRYELEVNTHVSMAFRSRWVEVDRKRNVEAVSVFRMSHSSTEMRDTNISNPSWFQNTVNVAHHIEWTVKVFKTVGHIHFINTTVRKWQGHIIEIMHHVRLSGIGPIDIHIPPHPIAAGSQINLYCNVGHRQDDTTMKSHAR